MTQSDEKVQDLIKQKTTCVLIATTKNLFWDNLTELEINELTSSLESDSRFLKFSKYYIPKNDIQYVQIGYIPQ